MAATYHQKMGILPEVIAVMRNVWGGQVTKGKLSQEAAQAKIDTLESFLDDYGQRKYVTLAGIMANDREFQTFVYWVEGVRGMATKEEAADYIRGSCNITSRRQLGYPKNKDARSKFDELRQRFLDWRRFREV